MRNLFPEFLGFLEIVQSALMPESLSGCLLGCWEEGGNASCPAGIRRCSGRRSYDRVGEEKKLWLAQLADKRSGRQSLHGRMIDRGVRERLDKSLLATIE